MTAIKGPLEFTKGPDPDRIKNRTMEEVRASVQASGALTQDDLGAIVQSASASTASWDDFNNKVSELLDGALGRGNYVSFVGSGMGDPTLFFAWTSVPSFSNTTYVYFDGGAVEGYGRSHALFAVLCMKSAG